MDLKANILRIERLSLSDGKGMRTVVFFKGCPLRCAWCSTPESQSGRKEVYYLEERCVGCGSCISSCPAKALSLNSKKGKILRDLTRCTNCMKCVDICNYRAHRIYGQEMTVKEVMKEILKDEMFFFYSDGGVTLSGGDIFQKTDFAEALLVACEDACISTAAEMDMFTTVENVRRIIPHLEMFYTDIKCMDSEKHKKWTGQYNERILENIREANHICAPKALHARLPLIENVNDDQENIYKTAKFCAELDNCTELEFLPYHRLGLHAYQQLYRPYLLNENKPMNRLDVYQKISFLFEEKLPFDISISGLTVYQDGKVCCSLEDIMKDIN